MERAGAEAIIRYRVAAHHLSYQFCFARFLRDQTGTVNEGNCRDEGFLPFEKKLSGLRRKPDGS
jgi:hypothetical protein